MMATKLRVRPLRLYKYHVLKYATQYLTSHITNQGYQRRAVRYGGRREFSLRKNTGMVVGVCQVTPSSLPPGLPLAVSRRTGAYNKGRAQRWTLHSGLHPKQMFTTVSGLVVRPPP
ncbi:unnamed protein product [Arctia plantaginis]|uniref:Uncharacterized protein n=1 Tax=Arctia plantaginis TaxID=874455 RepID=A0A8S0Z5G5_ARCPL|nr:unnamed protein product [Arctia plantaginis]